jgi:hypothetical protein
LFQFEAREETLRSGGETGVAPSLPSGLIVCITVLRLDDLDGKSREISFLSRMPLCVDAASSSGETGDFEVTLVTTPSGMVAGAGDLPCWPETLGRR